MDSIGIRAIAYALPDTTLDQATLAGLGLLESPASTLTEFGFCRVHISDRPAHDLALAAVRRLLDEERLDPESIDAIFFAGAIPSSHHVADGETPLAGFNYPAASIQYQCGLMNATALGVSQTGCTGLMTSVALAADHLTANPRAGRIVCVSADVLPPGSTREIGDVFEHELEHDAGFVNVYEAASRRRRAPERGAVRAAGALTSANAGGGYMASVSQTVVINTSVEAVYSFVADHPERATTFVPGLNRIENVSSPQAAPGQTWDDEFNWFGVVISGHSRCTRLERPRLYEFQTVTGNASTWQYRFEPDGGGTHVTLRVDYEVPQNQLARFATEEKLRTMNQERAAEALATLKGLVEE